MASASSSVALAASVAHGFHLRSHLGLHGCLGGDYVQLQGMTHESSTAGLRAWVEVDLGALVRNARALKAHAGVPLLPILKADAYGLGVVPVAHAVAALRPWGFGVATVDEGAELRDAGVTGRILVCTPLLPGEFAGRAGRPAHPDAERAVRHRRLAARWWSLAPGGGHRDAARGNPVGTGRASERPRPCATP